MVTKGIENYNVVESIWSLIDVFGDLIHYK